MTRVSTRSGPSRSISSLRSGSGVPEASSSGARSFAASLSSGAILRTSGASRSMAADYFLLLGRVSCKTFIRSDGETGLGSMLWKLRIAGGLALVLALFVPQSARSAGAGSFGPTGSMGTARYAAIAAPLPDGRVLVAGGFYDDGGGDHYLSSAEVFNPTNGAFSSAGIGAMSTPRRGAVAARLPDRRVLGAGGSYNDGVDPYLASAEVFDPATGAFTPVNDMGSARVRAAAAPL